MARSRSSGPALIDAPILLIRLLTNMACVPTPPNPSDIFSAERVMEVMIFSAASISIPPWANCLNITCAPAAPSSVMLVMRLIEA